ncbi:MAG: aminotransferase class V-fold PLP-dependent enzyme [Candidatus Levybacteria bacterium]|nr:aminotransferase class V-fold PLP-dependent enzyme [Candidatus Levybacteria bacterium]
MSRPIAIGLSPNTKKQDTFLAVQLLLSPWSYIEGTAIKSIEQWFRNFFGVSYAISFNSGRSALVAALKGVGVGEGDEVLLQAFTCVAVPNAILELDARPVYVDITDTLTIDPTDAKKKITAKTKTIIVQHTFGIPSDMDKIIALARKKNVAIIEDCAHTVGGSYQNKKLGAFGDAAIFSFGRDKAFSSVFGGMAITNNKVFGKKIRAFQKDKNFPSFYWVFQQLLHPIAFVVILPFYTIIGKLILIVLQKLRLLSFPIFPIEKKGKMVKGFVQKLPNALALLALLQLRRVNEYNKKREQFCEMYIQGLRGNKFLMPVAQRLPLLRFPILVEKRDTILSLLQKQGIYLGNWYANIIDPKDVDFKAIYYKRGSCPNAETLASKIINLPTYPTMTIADAQKVIASLKEYVYSTTH